MTVPAHFAFVGAGDELHAAALDGGRIERQPDAEAAREDGGVPVGLVLMPGGLAAVARRLQDHVSPTADLSLVHAKKLRRQAVGVPVIDRLPQLRELTLRAEHLREHLAAVVGARPPQVEVLALLLAQALGEQAAVDAPE